MGRHAGRHEPDLVEGQRAARGLGDVEVSEVNRVEGAAEQACAPVARHGTGSPVSSSSSSGCAARAIARHSASSSAVTPSPVTAEMG